jgi:hypothetical protein
MLQVSLTHNLLIIDIRKKGLNRDLFTAFCVSLRSLAKPNFPGTQYYG